MNFIKNDRLAIALSLALITAILMGAIPLINGAIGWLQFISASFVG